ncbi:unnamed protein product [Withania somnifera]
MSLITAKHFTLLVLLSFFVLQESYGLFLSLMFFYVLESQWAAFGKGYYNHAEKKINKKFADWELRGVPAGPDPLHHNGANPKKPRTP